MRIGLYFGSFNPIHNGHLVCARAVAETLGFDRIILVPAAHPPHKPASAEFAEPEHRLAMCRLAAALQPQLFEADDIELVAAGADHLQSLGSDGAGTAEDDDVLHG